jgi:hypothetical protein
MKRSRQLIAVALVATALCADRAVAAAPEMRTEASVASRIASRITTGLRRAVSSVRIYQPRQPIATSSPIAALRIDYLGPSEVHPTFFVSQFRLPPPAL